MRMTPRMPGVFGRIGMRATSPRVAPHSHEPAEDEFIFADSIADQPYTFTAKHNGLVLLGFFGRKRLTTSGPVEMSATYNGRPMSIEVPTYLGGERGLPGFVWITDAVMDEQATVEFTVDDGVCCTGAIKVMNPHTWVPVDREPAWSWSGNGGAGGSLSVDCKNTAVEQLLVVSGYGGVRTPITYSSNSNPVWIDTRSQLVVESVKVPGSKTSVAFAQMETSRYAAHFSQRENPFAPEFGYGVATWYANSLGLTAP